jgi:hypothetical protein
MEAVDAMSGVREKVSDWLWPSGAPTVLPAENEIPGLGREFNTVARTSCRIGGNAG